MTFGWRYFVRRVLISIVLLWLLSVITFAMYFAIPQNPENFVLGIRHTDTQHATAGMVAHARHRLGLDRPIPVQYAKFVSRALHGDFGISWQGLSYDPNANLVGAHVGSEVIRGAAVTGWLALGGLMFVLLLAIPAATFAAPRAGSWLDRTLLTVTLAGLSTHPIVIGVILQTFVGNRWHVAPPGGYCALAGKSPVLSAQNWSTNPQMCGGLVDWASHMALPWITFALFFVALYMRIVRVRLLDVLDTDYVRAARAKGASELRVLRRHALPNTILPVVTMLAMDIGTAVGVAVYVETVYRLPGLGRLTLGAIAGNEGFDLPVIVAVVLIVGTAIILLNLVADFVLALIDPRVESGGARRAHATAGVV